MAIVAALILMLGTVALHHLALHFAVHFLAALVLALMLRMLTLLVLGVLRRVVLRVIDWGSRSCLRGGERGDCEYKRHFSTP